MSELVERIIEVQVCERCGHVGSDVVTTVDPYAADVLGEDIEITACGDCLRQISDDI